MRKYVVPQALAPTAWPYPKYALHQALNEAVKVEAVTDLFDPVESP
jgi:hypothetical protein